MREVENGGSSFTVHARKRSETKPRTHNDLLFVSWAASGSDSDSIRGRSIIPLPYRGSHDDLVALNESVEPRP